MVQESRPILLVASTFDTLIFVLYYNGKRFLILVTCKKLYCNLILVAVMVVRHVNMVSLVHDSILSIITYNVAVLGYR